MRTRFSRRLTLIERELDDERIEFMVVLINRDPETGHIVNLSASVGGEHQFELKGAEADRWLQENPATITIGNSNLRRQ